MRIRVPRRSSERYRLTRVARSIDEEFFRRFKSAHGEPEAVHQGSVSGQLFLLSAHLINGASLRVDAMRSDGTVSSTYCSPKHGPASRVLPSFVRTYANIVTGKRTIAPAHNEEGIESILDGVTLDALGTGPFLYDAVHLVPRIQGFSAVQLLANGYAAQTLRRNYAEQLALPTPECFARLYPSLREHLSADEVPDENPPDYQLE